MCSYTYTYKYMRTAQERLGMNSKRKGNGGERELLSILQQYGKAERNDQTFVGGKDNPDIFFSDGRAEYHVECKRAERLNLHEALRQAEKDAGGKRIPTVIHRRNREPWYITMRLMDFLWLGKKEGEQ